MAEPPLAANDKGKGPVESSCNSDIHQTQFLLSGDPVAASEEVALQVLFLDVLIKRHVTQAEAKSAESQDLDLPIGERNPLADGRALSGRGTQQLSSGGAALGDVLRDGAGFNDLGAVGAFEGGDFAEGWTSATNILPLLPRPPS
ncbi:hypothetical protein IFM46972_11370 [Aspergillus udagawae]|uniref:Uncharacterized protein n=1 Tax=Aspergillus udagawae TaxID=91492 RepID=A0A8H3SG93_9EURO|nr:uncharacterized protein Aud_004407 [Aspergillus udagawae]GFF59386.1 hypothetical protein IFM46972_11370 [Aspergillus udagawae]GIC88016.1 hypothetical protein Aud_004407 [Aspergillus udagawae]